ncbi:MAG TPA: phage tail protein [Bryobacteraceae bacterium]|nr:phage tail protein [Bryobacteraceae bacterium]
MPTIYSIKEQDVLDTPIVLFDCVRSDGTTQHWSSHSILLAGQAYSPRVLAHNLFELRYGGDALSDGSGRLSITLANADSYFAQFDRATGWKGAKLTVRFAFYDLAAGAPTSEFRALYSGIAAGVDEVTESTFRISFHNRLAMQRLLLPSVRIQRRCPWIFPSNAEQRLEAVAGGDRGMYSPFFRCGYSAGTAGGVGNLDGALPFTTCNYTRLDCQNRGMLDTDGLSNVTRRFGGMEFLPAFLSDKESRGAAVGNDAVYNDFVPLVYGTAWFQPPVVLTRQTVAATHMDVLLGLGTIQGVVKVLVDKIEIPVQQTGRAMEATGWYRICSFGSRDGSFDPDFENSDGVPLGNPYGSIAYLHVMVPSTIHASTATPRVEVLVDGLKLARYDDAGVPLGETFTNNPAWVLLDILRRTGWSLQDLDLASFGRGASVCSEGVNAVGTGGETVVVSRYRCNLLLRTRRSASEVIRGIRNASGLYLLYAADGRLQLGVENSLEKQQAVKPSGSNSTAVLNNGWPAYEFGDGGYGFSGIARKTNGEPSLRSWSRSVGDTPNRLALEFQDEFNVYQRDSLSLTDIDDVVATGHEVAATPATVGIPNFSQAARVLRLHLRRSIQGNHYVEFDTTVKGIGLSPGDIITLTYSREALDRTPFRILTIAPGLNCSTMRITAQLHDDSWYTDEDTSLAGTGVPGRQGLHVPRPVLGTFLDTDGIPQYAITESGLVESDGGSAVLLSVSFLAPPAPSGSFSTRPRLSLRPQVFSTGGTLTGEQTLYYAVTSVDSGEGEGALSYVAAANLGPGSSTSRVVLTDLSFPEGTISFHVYRGNDPLQLLRIASAVTPGASFEDSGLSLQLIAPPDEYYHHANTYWRYEVMPPVAAQIYSGTKIGSDTLFMPVNLHAGQIVRITSGKGQAQERSIVSNTATTLAVSPPWTVVPDSTSKFAIAENNWHFGSSAGASPAEFIVPNRQGTSVHVAVRSANGADQESAYNLSPVSRWYITGDGGSVTDLAPPPIPLFGLTLGRQGTVELTGVSFAQLLNTRDISSGTLKLHYWDELSGQVSYMLSAEALATSTYIDLTPAGSAQAGDLVQVGAEILAILEVQNSGERYLVSRGQLGSSAQLHGSGSKLYHLDAKTFIVPFQRDFFGSPASGDYSYSQFLPDVRIAAGEFFVSNHWGNSPVRQQAYSAFSNHGLRTLSGGQFSIQLEGYLAIQTAAAPPLVVEDSHCARDIFATLAEAPVGGPIELSVRQNGALYCDLTIAAGSTTSNAVDGFGLPALVAASLITLDVVSVPDGTSAAPGRDLTVTIRL